MAAFGNPVQGLIRPPGSSLIVGNMRVTCSFACHEARTPPVRGTDIGDATCGKPVLAMTSGVISLIRLGKIGSTASADASIFRIRRPDGWEVGVGHHLTKTGFAVGQSITEGTVIGTLDKVGATACHIHVGCKDPSGTEVDVWPLLKQNGATEDDLLQGTNPARVNNRKGLVLGNNTRFRSGPSTADAILGEFDTGVEILPTYIVDGGLVSGSNKWYAAIALTPNGRELGYLHASTLGPLVAIELAGGHSDADVAALQAEIAEQQATINSQTARLSSLTGVISAKNSMLDAAILHEKPHTDLSAALTAARSR